LGEKIPRAKHGFERAIEAGILAVVYSAFANVSLLPHYLITLLNLVSITGSIASIEKSRYWPYTYFFGWVLGQLFLVRAGFYSIWEIVLYLFVCAGMVYIKFSK